MADGLTEVLDAVRARVKDLKGLDVLFLFGSRARGDVHAASDWDFAYLGAAHLDVERMLAALVLACDTDRVDLVDLARAGGLLRYRVARDGQAIIERHQGAADRFKVEAADFWCDAGPLLEREYEAILTNLHQ